MKQPVAYIDHPKSVGRTSSGPTPLQYLIVSLANCVISMDYIFASKIVYLCAAPNAILKANILGQITENNALEEVLVGQGLHVKGTTYSH
jgi:hypothetical protein